MKFLYLVLNQVRALLRRVELAKQSGLISKINLNFKNYLASIFEETLVERHEAFTKYHYLDSFASYKMQF